MDGFQCPVKIWDALEATKINSEHNSILAEAGQAFWIGPKYLIGLNTEDQCDSPTVNSLRGDEMES
jgi:hypothetical protein